ncbi:hypothetical protein ACC848_38435, partial [Rhizobium johnstonii]
PGATAFLHAVRWGGPALTLYFCMRYLSEGMHWTLPTMLLGFGGLLVLAAIIALVIRRSLKPLRSVADTAARVAAQPLDSGEVTITERVPAAEADADDEIGR